MYTKARDGEVVTIHSDQTRTIGRFKTLHTRKRCIISSLFLLNHKGTFEPTWGNAKCPKNIVGSEELNNLELAQIIADAQDELKYELVDFHSSRITI